MQTLTQVRLSDLELASWYGDTSDLSSQKASDLGIFSELAASIRQQSALLVLEDSVTKEAIYHAYNKDLELLQRYQGELETTIQAAVRCAIIGSGSNARQDWRRCQEAWELLKTQIPSGPAALLIDFPHTRAALPAPQLIQELRTEFRQGIDYVLQSLADWLRVLVANEFVGLVEWGDLDVCRYHYFKC